jgi:surface antigen
MSRNVIGIEVKINDKATAEIAEVAKSVAKTSEEVVDSVAKSATESAAAVAKIADGMSESVASAAKRSSEVIANARVESLDLIRSAVSKKSDFDRVEDSVDKISNKVQKIGMMFSGIGGTGGLADLVRAMSDFAAKVEILLTIKESLKLGSEISGILKLESSVDGLKRVLSGIPGILASVGTGAVIGTAAVATAISTKLIPDTNRDAVAKVLAEQLKNSTGLMANRRRPDIQRSNVRFSSTQYVPEGEVVTTDLYDSTTRMRLEAYNRERTEALKAGAERAKKEEERIAKEREAKEDEDRSKRWHDEAEAQKLASGIHLDYLKAEQEDAERAQKAGDERMLAQAKTSLRGLEEAWRDFNARRRESAEVNGDELTEMEKDRFIALHDITKEYTETVAGVLESGFGAFVSALKQTGSVLDALKDMFRSFVDYLIVQLLRILALKAAEAIINYFIPGAGTAIAGAAGTALNVAQHSSGGYVQRAAYGLGVTGGTPGVDSVPILAMAGERVLSRAETRAYETTHARGDVSPSPVAATNKTVVVNQSIVALTSSRAQLRRLQRDVLEPERRRLERSKAIRV